jgi:hypothetical protein
MIDLWQLLRRMHLKWLLFAQMLQQMIQSLMMSLIVHEQQVVSSMLIQRILILVTIANHEQLTLLLVIHNHQPIKSTIELQLFPSQEGRVTTTSKTYFVMPETINEANSNKCD